VPAATGAARAVALVIPELQGKFGGMAFRVPTPTVSVIDFTAVLEKKTNTDGINAAMQEASQGPLKGIMQYTEEPLVSTDLRGNTHSSIFSAMDTMMIGDDFCKVVSWYDNEWGYANRLADITAYVAERLG
jgi:glyceraldehyde 3-phosphate dehydrogenase